MSAYSDWNTLDARNFENIAMTRAAEAARVFVGLSAGRPEVGIINAFLAEIGNLTGSYLTQAAGDARYLQLTDYQAGDYITQAEADLLYAALSHTHAAADIASGTIASARIAGNYSGITGLGTLATELDAAAGIALTGEFVMNTASTVVKIGSTGVQFKSNDGTLLGLGIQMQGGFPIVYGAGVPSLAGAEEGDWVMSDTGELKGYCTLDDALYSLITLRIDGSVRIDDDAVGTSFGGEVTVSNQLILNLGTLTDQRAALNLIAEWNDGTEAFSLITGDVLNTASAATSKFIDLKVGGSSVFTVRTSGLIGLTGTSTNDTSVTFLTMTGSGGVSSLARRQKTGVTTSAVVIATTGGTIGAILHIVGTDGSNSFSDLINTGYTAGASPAVISSKTTQGAPAARTYTGSLDTVLLQMASGTYTIATTRLSTHTS